MQKKSLEVLQQGWFVLRLQFITNDEQFYLVQ